MYRTSEHIILVAHELPVLLPRPHVPQAYELTAFGGRERLAIGIEHEVRHHRRDSAARERKAFVDNPLQSAGRDVPQADRPILAARCEQLAVRRPGNASDNDWIVTIVIL